MSALAKPAPSPAALMPLPTVSKIFAALTELFTLAPRASQLKLAEVVRSTLGSGGICCVEAPTGTGKTLGYLAGALDQYAHSGEQVPIVVATATVGLQEQIIRYDVPRLVEIGALDPRRVAIAKGRGRYFCPRTAQTLEDKKMRDGQMDMFNSEKHVAEGGTQIALDMLHAWRDKAWDGDQDSWEGELPACWGATCAASSDTCVNRACEYFSSCPYMESRAKLGRAQLIIANHDMVLADLAQRADEQSTTALPPKKYALIFDEAHNLPEKAVNTRRASARLSDTDWLRQLEGYSERCLTVHKVQKALERGVDFGLDVFTVGAANLIAEMEHWAKHLLDNGKFSLSGDYSWGLATPDSDLVCAVGGMASTSLGLLKALKTASKAFAEVAEESVGAEKGFAVRMLAETHRYQRLAKELQEGLALFYTAERQVRWATRTRDNRISLQTQPLEGREVLDELLWSTNFPVALVSATLQIAGSFQRFKDKSGLPGHAITEALPPVFDYSRGFLHQPKMDCLPGEEGYELELVDKIERLYKHNVAPGMLILFTSRETMRKVVGALKMDVREKCLTPDHMPLPELVALHKERILSGGRSILVGLDSMAEGLDLPGMFCGHVVITRLPFAVPGDPVEEARREHLGDAWFEQAYLADMLITLIQATGRLIRREDDHGVITVLDKRLHTKKYAMTAFAALPNFTRGTLLSEYDKMATARKLDKTHGQAAKVAAARAAAQESESKPAAKLTLVVDNAPKSVPASAMVAQVVPAEDPMAAVVEQAALPSNMGYPADDVGNEESVYAYLARTIPTAAGPFSDHEAAYLDCVQPTLPVGTPAHIWAERLMPEAVALGMIYLHQPWSNAIEPWKQILRLRADALQFAEILRSHMEGRPDPRTKLVSEQTCLNALMPMFSRVKLDPHDLLQELRVIEAEAWDVLTESHRMPRKELLLAMGDAAVQIALKHQATKKRSAIWG